MNSRIALVSLVLLLVSCGSASPVAYYVIDPVDVKPVANLNKESIQIIDLKIPQYLERFQIATRTGRNQLSFSDTHQWGENLRKNLLRTLARNLSRLLGTEDVATPLSRSLAKPNYRLQVNIEQFDLQTNGNLLLAARYQLSAEAGQVLGTYGFEAQAEDIDAGNHAAIVNSMQSLFGDLSTDIARQIAGLDTAK